MSKNKPKIRLYIPQDLSSSAVAALSEAQSHYLKHVMRLLPGDSIRVFDGKTGEYEARLEEAGKKLYNVSRLAKTRDYAASPDIWLVFAPVKKDQTDFIVEKAVELGVSAILPVSTRYSISSKINQERYEACAIEAAEQCRRLDLPKIFPLTALEKLLREWPKERALFFMDESGSGNDVFTVFCQDNSKAPAAILVGPEGGFAEEELKLLRSLDFCIPVSLGKRILRAETAVAAALSCWQAIAGDWR